MRDIEGETAPLSELDIARMQAMKTGALIRAAVRMGAILGGADRDTLGHLTATPKPPAAPSSSPTTCSTSPPRPPPWARRPARTPATASRRWSRSIGVEAARRHLGDIVHDAITALTPFGPEADTLRAAARYFATRES